MPQLSIIVPTSNNQETIEDCLCSIRKSAYIDYELIVVDSQSNDSTVAIAKKYADKVIEGADKTNRNAARNSGIQSANGEIIVNIDSDVIIRPDTLGKINEYFLRNPQIDALTGLLSQYNPYNNFFSQYKNLYMHYIFSKLPSHVTFLYGSLYAIKKDVSNLYDFDFSLGEDTASGQKIFNSGKRIDFVRSLEITHKKWYNAASFIKNDFLIPLFWAKIFWKYKGWKQLGRLNTGYAHAPKEQLISVIIAPALFILSLFTLVSGHPSGWVVLVSLVWLSLNLPFILFLTKKKGLVFGACALPVTFLDHIVMSLGIICGSAAYLYRH